MYFYTLFIVFNVYGSSMSSVVLQDYPSIEDCRSAALNLESESVFPTFSSGGEKFKLFYKDKKGDIYPIKNGHHFFCVKTPLKR